MTYYESEPEKKARRIQKGKAFLDSLPTEPDVLEPWDIRLAGNELPDMELPKTKIDLRSESYK